MRRTSLAALLIATALAMPFAVVTWLNLLAPGADGVTRTGTYAGIDFVNFWSGGRLVLEGLVAEGYDAVAYKALLKTWFAPATQFTNLSYPPSLLPWLTPFALLPFNAAYGLWMGLGGLAFVSAVVGRWPERRDLPLCIVVLISPVVISNFVFGQIALFMAAIFIWALRVLPERPVLAGVMIGFLTLKPQLGLLLPIFLVAIGAWRTIAAAAAAAIVLGAISIVLFGVAPWQAYLTDTAHLQWSYILAMDDFYAIHMTTPYAGLWALGVPVQPALAVQWMISAAIAVTTVFVARSQAEWPLKAAILTLGSLMVVPYALAHDLAVPLAALAWYWNARIDDPSPMELGLAGALWLLPFPLTFLLQFHGLPVTQVVMAALYVWLAAQALGWRTANARNEMPTSAAA